jgi:hypothetical protein
MDIVTLTDAYLGMDKWPVRIISIEEDESLRLKITAEEFPWSCSAPTLYPKQAHTPTQPGFFADPGSVNTPLFISLPDEITQGLSGYVLGIAASGSQNWGGCDVYMATSEDGPYDTFVGRMSGSSTMGVLTAVLAIGADPDTTHTLSVDLTESYGVLASYTHAQADALDLLVAVDQELLSYGAATFTGDYAYNITYLRRGVYGSVNAAHAIAAPFCVLDTGILRWNYPASVIGQTVWFKFCSINLAGRQKQDLSMVTAFSCTVAAPPRVYEPTANTDFTIPTGNVLVLVTATTRDCTATLPPEVPDQGDTVTVQLTSVSTYKCIIEPDLTMSDTIDGSSSAVTLDPATGPIIWKGLAT